MVIDRLGLAIEPTYNITDDRPSFSLLIYRENKGEFEVILNAEDSKAITLYALITGQAELPELPQGTEVLIPKECKK